ncbi:similar to DUTP-PYROPHOSPHATASE-LIKE 1 [Actinidia rufa]|uniref:Deoxyuridine 5'-triphosphate nucleotidohydrolase n=1 Tax=Actinidia rufa TaxID=165716 RepID=A0A7J0EI49_9ERIC|nr:similar to DUTP-PYROPHOSPHATASE-LIKE 1 [Actinidia rufa]
MVHQDPQINGSEIIEPSPKVRKLDRNVTNGAPKLPAAPILKVKKLSEKAVLPSRASPLSAGYDLSSAKEIKVPARGKALVSTDLSIAIPEGTYARIGVQWGSSSFNHSDTDFEVKIGDRIAQLIIEVIMIPDVAEVDDLDWTARGAGGFGSTGI